MVFNVGVFVNAGMQRMTIGMKVNFVILQRFQHIRAAPCDQLVGQQAHDVEAAADALGTQDFRYLNDAVCSAGTSEVLCVKAENNVGHIGYLLFLDGRQPKQRASSDVDTRCDNADQSSRACAMSAMISSMCSRPVEKRTMPGLMPAATSCSSVS